MLVLVVDDEANVRKLLETVLVCHGYEVIEAENGLQGLQVAKQQPCDIVITDQVMPLLSGLDMISRLATEGYRSRYLLISGYSTNQRVPHGVSFLSKPFTSRQLMDAVERLQEETTLPELERAGQLAKRVWRESVGETEQILSDVPSQIPHSDETLRLESAALKRRTTYEGYFQAFHKYKEA